MDFISELRWRGLLQQHTEGLDELLKKGLTRGYIGFDPTAPSLGIGNYVQVMTLKRFQQAGHQPIVLMGGATGRIGDPSGKDAERSLLDLNTIEQNIARQKEQIAKFLNFDTKSENCALLVNNWDFYKNMNAMDFLRDVGKYITVNYMLGKESVKNRIESESGISFTEFSYQLIQGYDFERLCFDMNCPLQMGGSDQWGNITTGMEFIRKKGGKGHGLSTQLLTKKDGKKFGKSEAGNLFLDRNLTSPYTFYQYWLGNQIDDEDLPKLFRVLSMRSQAEIEQLETEFKDNPIRRRELLAEELMLTIHDENALNQAKAATQVVHNPKLSREFLSNLDAETWQMVGTEVGSFTIDRNELQELDFIKLLTEKTQLFPSNGEARKAVQNNAIALNCEKVANAAQKLAPEQAVNGFMLLQTGRKSKYVLKID